MREDTVAGPCVNLKTPVGVTVQDVNEGVGGNDVEVPLGRKFPCQLQLPSQLSALSPCLQWKKQRPAEEWACSAGIEESNLDCWLLLEDDSPLMAAMAAESCTVAEGEVDKSTDKTNPCCWWLYRDQSL
jgi:hypothetical protein